MTELANAALLGIDWGTSSLRAVALDASGRILAQRNSPSGIQAIEPGAFEQTLEALLAPWQIDTKVPVVLSGMITSRNGWVETPYLPTPAALDALAGALVPLRSAAGRRLHFVPGVSQAGPASAGVAPDVAAGPQADVMRGEETELLGWLAAARQKAGEASAPSMSGQFVLPGTHSKWAQVQDGRIESFATCMTGEIFHVLSKHTILSKLMEADAVSPPAFTAGAELGLREPARLLAHCFSVRALPLLGRMPVGQTRDYLGGLLVGAEVAGQIDQAAHQLIVIGRGDLAARYAQVIAMAGRQAVVAEPGSAAHGQLALARLAGLL